MNNKIKTAFYMNNNGIALRNLRDIENGNPGIGGSHYMQILLAHCLAQQYQDIAVTMYVTERQCFPAGIESKTVKGIEDALCQMKKDKCSVFILSNWMDVLGTGTEVLELIEKYRIKTIIWAHIFMNYQQYAYMSVSKYIRLFVCLGKQQLEMMRGLRLYRKSTYINYAVPPVHTSREIHDKKIVVYVGALYPYKGFHILAKYWKSIKKEVRDAQLWVVGSAKLYGDHIQLGKYGIAEAGYEKQFVQYLRGTGREIDASVHFLGNLGGSEKEKVVSQATVGIFNPCGRTETFGLSGVEFEAMGIPVVSIYRNSSLDIIKHEETGLLYKDEKEFPEYIIKLLKDSEYNQYLGRQARDYVTEEFKREKMIREWYEAIVCVSLNQSYYLKHDKSIIIDNQIWLHHIDNMVKEHTKIRKFIWESKLVTGA